MKPSLTGRRSPRLAACLASVLVLSPALRAADVAIPAPGPSTAWIVGLITLFALLLAGWCSVVWRARRAILNRLQLLAVSKTRGITSQRLRSISVRRIIQLARIGTRLASLALILAGAAAWITYTLETLPGTRAFALKVEHLVHRELQTLALAALGALPGLGVVALIYFVTRVVHEMLNHYFRSITDGETQSPLFDTVTAETTRRLASLGVWIAAIIIAFPYIPGSHTAAFRGITVLGGLMLSFGSANLVGQFASGLALIYGRNLRPGEYIEAGGSEGVLESIGAFACSLRTARNEIVVLPHTTIANGLKNFSRNASAVRYAAVVTIGYDTPWRRVRDLLLAAAARTEGIRTDPAPVVRQAGLEDFYVSYELLFTPEDPRDRQPLLGRLHAEIQDRFHEAGVQIMSPHYRADPADPKIPPAA